MRVVLGHVDGGEQFHAVAHRNAVFVLRVVLADVSLVDFLFGRFGFRLRRRSRRRSDEDKNRGGKDQARGHKFGECHSGDLKR